MEPHFVNELRAFYNRPQRWSTQIRFGPLSRDTGYRQRQHQQGGPPPPQPTMQSFMEAVHNDMQTVHQDSTLPIHASPDQHEVTPPPQTINSDHHNQNSTPPVPEYTQPRLFGNHQKTRIYNGYGSMVTGHSSQMPLLVNPLLEITYPD